MRSPSISANRTALVETAQTPVRARRHPNLRLQPALNERSPDTNGQMKEYGGNEYGGLPVMPADDIGAGV